MGKFIDLTGMKFGKLTVMKKAPNRHNRTAWYCNCECGANDFWVTGNALQVGNTKSCGCGKGEFLKGSKIIDMTGWIMSEHGVENSKILVVKFSHQGNGGDVYWECKCSCGRDDSFIRIGKDIRSGEALSCGKCINKYDLTNEYGIGYTANTNIEFLFDLEDYEKIKKYKWNEDLSGGYIITFDHGKCIRMHNLIMNSEIRTQDHINGKRYDNRKCNLRKANTTENSWNKKKLDSNTSGYPGVSVYKPNGKFRAYITINKKQISLGYYLNIEDAINARKNAEIKYFGEFRREHEE